MNEIKVHQLGDVTIVKIEEKVIRPLPLSVLYPDLDPAHFLSVASGFSTDDVAGPTNDPVLSIHAWLIKTPQHKILLDPVAGNHKNRPGNPVFHNQDLPFMERLAAAGALPEDIDYVFCTHLHVDHVGWNTRLRDGKWVPTFPNARYMIPRVEQAYYSSEASHNEANIPNDGTYEDSVQPIVEAGLVDYVEAEGGRYLEIFDFIPTRGHSIGHMSILMKSKGEEALFGGDLTHHPTQIFLPELNTFFCEFKEDATASRLRMLEYCAATGAMYFPMHFPGPSAGYITKSSEGFLWTYA